MKYIPEVMNLELTTCCPLHCPQCYIAFSEHKHLALDKAVYWMKQGRSMGVKYLNLSGGETMCYPHLYDVIAAAKAEGLLANVALSGWGFDQAAYEKMIDSGVYEIFVSLNGSCEEINRKSRDGYEYAISALELLQKNKYHNTTINWVMHSTNADDFEDMVKTAEKYEVRSLAVIGLKPTAKHELSSLPSREQMYNVAKIIREYDGPVKLCCETCFSPLLALVCENSLWGNLNRFAQYKGCSAGKCAFSVDVDGRLTPCRHLDYPEEYATLAEYWSQSDILRQLRSLEDNKREPCASCRLCQYCCHCVAVNAKTAGELFIGNKHCSIYEEKQCKTVPV